MPPNPTTVNIYWLPCLQNLKLSSNLGFHASKTWNRQQILASMPPKPETVIKSWVPCFQNLKLSANLGFPASNTQILASMPPKPETVSNCWLPCLQNLKLSAITAFHAGKFARRRGGSPHFAQNIVFCNDMFGWPGRPGRPGRKLFLTKLQSRFAATRNQKW